MDNKRISENKENNENKHGTESAKNNKRERSTENTENTLRDYCKRKIRELNLIDDLLFTVMATDDKYAAPCLKIILSVLLEKEISEITVHGQKILPGDDTDLRGVRLDVEVTESEDGNFANLYDIEPHTQNDLNFPRHSRYYQAKIDGHHVESGLTDFSKVPNLYVITITNFDIFGEGQMVYTFRNQCKELPSLQYDDGLTFLYFNTKGTKGGSKAIRNMLLYIQDSRKENAVDKATHEVADYVDSVVNSKRMEDTVMTFGYKLDQERRAGVAEGAKEATITDIGKFVVMLKKNNVSKTAALDSLNEQYPDYSEVIIAKIDEIYQ